MGYTVDGIGIIGASLWVCFVVGILKASIELSIEESSYRLIITNHKVETRRESNSESIMMHHVEAVDVDYEELCLVVRSSGGTKIIIDITGEGEKIRRIITQAAMLAHKHKDSVA